MYETCSKHNFGINSEASDSNTSLQNEVSVDIHSVFMIMNRWIQKGAVKA